MDKKLIALVGPSGSGKTAIIDYLIAEHSEMFEVPKALTTRNPRPGEGTDEYHFVSEETFLEQLNDGTLLEHSTYAGYRYGLRKQDVDEIIARGKFPLRAMDLPGAKNAHAHSIFIERNAADLLDCLFSRNLADDDLLRRVKQLPGEMRNAANCDFVIRNNRSVEAAGEVVMSYLLQEYGRIVDAEFTSVWNDGEYSITTNCQVNLLTKEVFNIETDKEHEDDLELLNELDEEYISINGVEYSVSRKEDAEDGDFWYD